jgi:SAM-dependent methyltransferase
MDPFAEDPAATGVAEPGPDETLAEIRAEIATGTPLVGSLATRFYRAVHALDPAATEESLAVLPGNRGVQLYDSPIAWAPVVAGERVLDLGCGSGGATRAAARVVGPEGMVVGVDSSPECIAEAQARTPADLPVLYRRGDAQHMANVPDRAFDCVVASLVLEQVADLARTAGEIFRVLRPGGRLVATVTAFDRLRPIDASFMGAVIAVVGRRAPGALAGRATRRPSTRPAWGPSRSRTSSSPSSWRTSRGPGPSSRAPTSPTCSTRRAARSCVACSSGGCPTPSTCRCASCAAVVPSRGPLKNQGRAAR